jgi:hypothetical protein
MPTLNLFLTDTITLSDVAVLKDLEHIKHARTMDIDALGRLWIATYTDPTKLVRITNPDDDYIVESWDIN